MIESFICKGAKAAAQAAKCSGGGGSGGGGIPIKFSNNLKVFAALRLHLGSRSQRKIAGKQLCASLPGGGSDVSFHGVSENNTGTDADVWKSKTPTKNKPQREHSAVSSDGARVWQHARVGRTFPGVVMTPPKTSSASALQIQTPAPQPPACHFSFHPSASQENVSLPQTTLKTREGAIPVSAKRSKLPQTKSFEWVSSIARLQISYK